MEINNTPVEEREELELFDDIDAKIKEYLKSTLPDEVYENWIDKFVFESVDEKQITVGYYGVESLREFEKEYKEMVWLHVCSVVGYVKSMKIYKRKSDSASYKTGKTEKRLKVLKLFFLSLLFAVIMLVIGVVAVNYMGNHSFKENFYSTSSIKADSKVRIVQISDLHTSRYGKENSKLIDRVTKLNPNVILYTGDIVDSGSEQTDRAVSLCKALADVAPSYYIYGNNETELFYDTPLNQDDLDKKFGFSDENRDPAKLTEMTDPLEKALESAGVKVLKNEMDTIVAGKTEVDIYGVLTSNPSSFWSYAGESFEQYIRENPNRLKITAIHEPFIFEEFQAENWGDVMLCGHTHGGTIRVPVLGPLYTHEGGLFPERNGDFIYGRYDVSGSPLIVSSGLHNKTIFRINNQPELVIVDVNRY